MFKRGQLVWYLIERCYALTRDTPDSWIHRPNRPEKVKVRILTERPERPSVTFLDDNLAHMSGWNVDNEFLSTYAEGPDAYKECNDLNLFPMEEVKKDEQTQG